MTVRKDKQQIINFLDTYWRPRMCQTQCTGDTEMNKAQFGPLLGDR